MRVPSAIAEALSPHLKRLDERLRQHFAGDRYARYSDSRKLHEALTPVLQECKGLTRERLDQEAAEAIGRLAPLESVEGSRSCERACEQPLHFEERPHGADSRI